MGDGYCLGRNLWSLSHVGISFQISLSVKEVSSGPRPRSLDILQVLSQFIFGLSISHFSGLSGQSETGVSCSPAIVSGSVLRTEVIRNSYICLVEISSMFRPDRLSLRIV